eukprot:Skav203112  [mRNA]  locus=scaffold447:467805:471024:+ [translate_table: standard]
MRTPLQQPYQRNCVSFIYLSAMATEVSQEEWKARAVKKKSAVDDRAPVQYDLVRSRKSHEALAEALRDPPYGAHEMCAPEDVKDEVAKKVVLSALSAFREADIKEAVASLDEDAQILDVQMVGYRVCYWLGLVNG